MESKLKIDKELATVKYINMTDGRTEGDKKTQVEKSCISPTGMFQLGDDQFYSESKIIPPMLSEFNNNLLLTLEHSQAVKIKTESDSLKLNDYIFSSNLEFSKLMLDDTKAVKTQQCIGGLVGALVVAQDETTTTTDIVLTGKLIKNKKEVWSHKVNFNRVLTDVHKNLHELVERSIDEGIGEACGELADEMVKFLDETINK